MKKNIITTIVILAVVGLGYYFISDMGSNPTQLDNESYSDTLQPKERYQQELISYETEVDSADECSSYEKYDEEASVCYFECSSEQECTDIQNHIDDELSGWVDEGVNDNPVNEESESDIQTLASYKITSGEKATLVSGKDTSEYKTIWNEIKELSPDNITDKYIETYEVYDDQNSDSLAFVDDSDQNGKWRIVINLAGRRVSDLREQKMTLIHELGHVITLNTSQVNANYTSCATYELDEGCSNKNSYINTFYNTYWNGVMTPAKYVASKFVTEYAASEPVEDLAETFAFFVLEKDKEKLNNEIKDQKIKMLYNYPELVQIRKEMRNTLSRDVVRSRKLQTN